MIEDFYKDIEIYEKTGTGDFDPVTWAKVGDYTGFIQKVSASEVFQDGKAGEKATHRLYTGLSTPGKYGYRVNYTGSTQYYIMLTPNQEDGISSVEHHKEIIMGLFK